MLVKNLLVSIVLVAASVGWVGAAQVAIEGLHIDSGTFATDVLSPISISSDPSINLMLSPPAPEWNQTVVQSEAHETSIVSFELNGDGVWANSYFSSAATGFIGTNGLNGIDEGNTIEVDLSGFNVNFNGVSFSQGGIATGTISNLRLGPPGLQLFDYDLIWNANVTGSSIEGVESSWSIAGFGAVVSPVPVPAAVWLLGSGIFGLLGFSRRHSRCQSRIVFNPGFRDL